jgi:hypothetical protein
MQRQRHAAAYECLAISASMRRRVSTVTTACQARQHSKPPNFEEDNELTCFRASQHEYTWGLDLSLHKRLA